MLIFSSIKLNIPNEILSRLANENTYEVLPGNPITNMQLKLNKQTYLSKVYSNKLTSNL